MRASFIGLSEIRIVQTGIKVNSQNCMLTGVFVDFLKKTEQLVLVCPLHLEVAVVVVEEPVEPIGGS
jgi:hypothetical protein